MAEHDASRFLAGHFFDTPADVRAHAAEPHFLQVLIHFFLADLHRTFRNDNICKSRTALLAGPDLFGDRVERKRYFRYQYYVRASRKSRVQGDPAGISPHHLEDHHPVVRRGSRV